MVAKPDTLSEVADEFNAVTERAVGLWNGLESVQRCARPSPREWSVAACLGHLTMSTTPYLSQWDEAFKRARADGLTGRPPFRLDLWGRFLVWFLEPPPRFRFRAPDRFKPGQAQEHDRALDEFLVSQRALLDAVSAADGLAIDRISIRSPFDSRVRYSVWSSFRTHLAHQRRHLWQAEQVASQLQSRYREASR